jgi:hypothetical protein
VSFTAVDGDGISQRRSEMYVIVHRSHYADPIGPFETREAAEDFGSKECGPKKMRANEVFDRWRVRKLEEPISRRSAA